MPDEFVKLTVWRRTLGKALFFYKYRKLWVPLKRLLLDKWPTSKNRKTAYEKNECKKEHFFIPLDLLLSSSYGKVLRVHCVYQSCTTWNIFASVLLTWKLCRLLSWDRYYLQLLWNFGVLQDKISLKTYSLFRASVLGNLELTIKRRCEILRCVGCQYPYLSRDWEMCVF